MYICNRCGNVCEENEMRTYREDYGFDTELGHRQIFVNCIDYSCDCGGEYVEASYCPICGNYFCDDFDLDTICRNCLEENATLENAIEIGETETLSLRLNGFLATFFSGEQIENILKKEIMQLAQSGGDCLAEINQKAKDYCLEDCIWFSEWIEKKYT